jgi:Delta14-sterol reductase
MAVNKDATNGTTTSHAKTPSSRTINHSAKTDQFPYEFGGPVGAAAILIVLPWVVLSLVHWSRIGKVDLAFVSDIYHSIRNPHLDAPDRNASLLGSVYSALFHSPVLCPSCTKNTYISSLQMHVPTILFCALVIVGWFLFQVLLERCLPAEIARGAPIRQHPTPNYTLSYRINGHLAFWVTFLVAFVGWPRYAPDLPMPLQFGLFPHFSWIYEHCAELALATILLCFLFNTYLYLRSFRRSSEPVILAAGGNSGNHIYDYFIGRELNPRPSSSSTALDWKEFCELRPGLIGWVLLNVSCAHEQYRVLGGYLSGSMILLQVFQLQYVWDALYQEKAILTTMDITTDGFGFMLLFGDLCWVPFTYSLQARYLVHHDPQLPLYQLLLIVGLHMFGYYIFRSANGEKDAFRKNPNDPSVAHLSFLSTQRGTKLLTSGWWGRARKINYTGDYLMGLSWCLTCGVGSIAPYYYAIYFLILLVHRSERDDHMCHEKYGTDWITYKRMVPYRFIPGVV